MGVLNKIGSLLRPNNFCSSSENKYNEIELVLT